MSNKVFEANFTTTGSPTINIYEVNKDVYTLVKSDTMVATPETGKYAYNYDRLNQTKDYSARMELGTESVDAVWNGIFSQIFAKAGTGGGFAGETKKFTKDELKDITDQMTDLFKESLSGVEVSLPDDLGKKELLDAIESIKLAGIDNIKQISDKIRIAKPEKFDESNLLKSMNDAFEKTSKSLIENKDSFNSVFTSLNDMLETLSGSVKGGFDKNEDRFTKMLKAMKVINERRKKDGDLFTSMAAAFRKEIIK